MTANFQNAVLTGACGGLGQALARELIGQGAAVALECAEAGGPEVPDEAPQAGQAQGFPNAEDCPPVHSLTEGI